jgi:hypothetical protein
METHRTGESRYRVPASLCMGTIEASTEVHFLISTRKVGAVVLLEIEMADATEPVSA